MIAEAEQLTLWQPIVEVPRCGHLSLADRFEAFHQANPHVYAALCRLALDLRRQGIERYGCKALCEVLRWRYITATHGDEWRINNSYVSFYARLLMRTVPELVDFFETRTQEAA